MSGENSSRRSGRRRRRRPRRSQKNKSRRQNQVSAEATLAQGPNHRSARDKDELPDVFIYTYTIYKTGD